MGLPSAPEHVVSTYPTLQQRIVNTVNSTVTITSSRRVLSSRETKSGSQPCNIGGRGSTSGSVVSRWRYRVGRCRSRCSSVVSRYSILLRQQGG